MPHCTVNSDTDAVKIIVEQNDRFRSEILTTKPQTVPGRLVLSPSVRMLDPEFIDTIMLGLGHAWNAHPLADPHSERDCGTFTVRGEQFVWQIDLMATDHRAYVASDRPDLKRTWRVLTVKVAGER